MKEYSSIGTICIKGPYNLIYSVCDLEYFYYGDDSFKYIFKPHYSVINLLSSNYFQGIPGLNIDLQKKEYIRKNIKPTFISERVPSINRVDYYELLRKVKMDFMDPILYLIKTDEQYFGDNLFMLPKIENKECIFDNTNNHESNNSLIKKVLDNICLGNNININNQIIDDNNRKIFHDIFLSLYSRSLLFNKEKQKEGIKKAKSGEKYKGRKPIEVDKKVFMSLLKEVEANKITAKVAASTLGISIDKYYRVKKQLKVL